MVGMTDSDVLKSFLCVFSLYVYVYVNPSFTLLFATHISWILQKKLNRADKKPFAQGMLKGA